jgi:hypothetical protein
MVEATNGCSSPPADAVQAIIVINELTIVIILGRTNRQTKEEEYV